MPKQNRVTPFGTLIATPERGTLFGNRGCLVGRTGEIRRQFNGIRWIICQLKFKGRRHPVMEPGLYTGLFFLDEATALAAGHRPCAECQRGRFNLFRDHWSAGRVGSGTSLRPLAPAIDTVLHEERLGTRPVCNSIEQLPDGTFVSNNGINAYIVMNGRMLLWTPGSYVSPPAKPPFPLTVLTPASTIAALRVGYPASLHPTASVS